MRAETDDFESILWPQGGDDAAPQDEATLHDLALDQVAARIDHGAPRAASAFRVPLRTEAEVEYRQAVFRGLEDPALRRAVEEFLHGMGECARREDAAAQAHHPYQAELWHLGAVVRYVETVDAFSTALVAALNGPDDAAEGWYAAEGWEGLAGHSHRYRDSAAFRALRERATGVRDALAAVRYNALIRGGKVTIARTDDEADLGEIVLSTFERFRQSDVADHRTAFRPPTLDHVQAWMLERVAQVHPEPFEELVRFARDSRDHHDPVLDRFADEVRFYRAYLDALAPLRAAGLPACYPEVSAHRKDLAVTDTWDLALAARLVGDGEDVVTNDVSLTGAERILVISGPNQGGKTTMARMFGQLHHLAAIGCPVPGTQAQVFLSDRVHTVFEHEERAGTVEGRLGAEVDLLHRTFETATGRSVIVINEAFASTALHDARILTRDVLERISALGALGACVTFIDELSRLNERTVSMVSTVDPEDPSVRTFRVERRVADGRAYARALAVKHGLTLEQIRARIDPGTAPDVAPDPGPPARARAEDTTTVTNPGGRS